MDVCVCVCAFSLSGPKRAMKEVQKDMEAQLLIIMDEGASKREREVCGCVGVRVCGARVFAGSNFCAGPNTMYENLGTHTR